MKKFFSLLVLFISIMPVFSIQEERKISLEEAIELSLKTNPQMQLAHLNTLIAKNNILYSARLKNPSLVFVQNIPKAGKGNPQIIGIEQEIELFKRKKYREAAKISALVSVNNEKFAEHILINEVKKSYITLLVKKTNLDAIQKQSDLEKENYNQLKKENSDRGLIIQAKIASDRSKVAVNNAKLEVISAQNYFNAVLNTSDVNYDTKEDVLPNNYSELLAVNPDIKIPSLNEIKQYAIANRLDLAGAKNQIEEAKIKLQSVKKQRIPDLTLGGGYAYQTKGMSDDNTFQSGGYVEVGLVNIPLLYNYKPEIQNAEIEVKKAELKYQDLEIDAIRNITDAYEKFITARDNLKYYNQNILEDLKIYMDLLETSVDTKDIDMTTYLVSKKICLDLILDYNETLGEYYISFSELLKELNSNKTEFNNI